MGFLLSPSISPNKQRFNVPEEGMQVAKGHISFGLFASESSDF
jgi:hypothetical protein